MASGLAKVSSRAAPRPWTPKSSAIVIWTLSTWLRFHKGSSTALPKRKYTMLCTGPLPRKWSKRKIALSSKAPSRMRLSSRAEAPSRPKGFSTMTRAPLPQPDLLNDHPEVGGRNSQIKDRVLSACERLTQGAVGQQVRIIALHVAQQRAELVERRGVESPMLFKTRPYPRPEFIHIFRRPGHADYRHV